MSFSFGVQAQLEGSKKIKLSLPQSKDKSPKVAPLKKLTIPKTEQVIKYEPEFFKPKSAINFVSTVPKVGESEPKRYGYKNPGDVYNKRIEKINNELEPQFVYNNYGTYFSNTKKIKILCRDYDIMDGDMVRVLINGIPVVKNCLLGPSFQTYYVDLDENNSVIDFLALNEGDGPPNTAEFVIYDDDNVLIYSNKWSLQTGYKARIVINRK